MIESMGQTMISSLKRGLKSILYRNHVPCFWSNCDNWGDALTPYLVEAISGKTVRYDSNPTCWKHLVIGSILDRADRFSIVWGTGMISPVALPKQTPHRIYAVRGPLTRERLMNAGLACPGIFGDPALLLPRYYCPPRVVTHSVGVIPHMIDKDHPWVHRIQGEENVKIIDIEAGIEAFVNDVVSCEQILSSSLHGLICADAYGIPNRRIVLSNNLMGGDFKFNDYYGSMNLKPETPITPGFAESAKALTPGIQRGGVSLDLDSLFAVCPFR